MNAGKVGSILKANARYWKDAGNYKGEFRWDLIVADGLLPKPKDPGFLDLCAKVRNAGFEAEALSYPELAMLLFGKDGEPQMQQVAPIICTHRLYVEIEPGIKVRFLWDRIEPTTTPECWPPLEELVSDLRSALSSELNQADQQVSLHSQKLTALESVAIAGLKGHCYKACLKDADHDHPIPLMEGMKVLVEWNGKMTQKATLLVYDQKTFEVILEFAKVPLLQGECRIRPDTARILKSYMGFINLLPFNPMAVRVLYGNGALKKGCGKELLACQGDLRPRQEDIVRASLTNDVLYVWGPPGTGKTYTLAALIAEAALRGERVLAVSISNRAIDELAQDVHDRLSKTKAGQALLAGRQAMRLGFASPEILRHKELFPHHEMVDKYRKELLAVKEALAKSVSNEEKAVLQQRQEALNEALKSLMKESINSCRVVLTTVCQVAMAGEFLPENALIEGGTQRFDMAVCDEASMMNATHVLPVCWWATQRIVIAGDYQQLGPVVLSTAQMSLKYLHTSLFERERRPGHGPRMLQLTEQSRMHPSICEPIAKTFYGGNLATTDYTEKLANPPLMIKGLWKMGLLQVKGAVAQLTAHGSRHNQVEANVVVNLLAHLLNAGCGRVGIVTPYRAQTGILRKLLAGTEWAKSDRVQVGTIHAFQGSEADAIIWSMVDTKQLRKPDGTIVAGKPGRLYKDRAGERLVNVGISRARSAVYLVGDIELFVQHAPTNALRSIMNMIHVSGHRWTSADLNNLPPH